ncbi:acyltransferase family protein [Coprobacter sp.]
MKDSGNKIFIEKSTGEIIQGRNSFDIIRYFLSFAVLVDHFSIITGASYYFLMRSVDAVHGFFILSGFLVFYSYVRNPSIRHYTERRARRILPPYLFIVTLCWISGSIISVLPVKEYFFSEQLWKYILANYSFLNFLEPALPGCFDGDSVNGSLWTLKVEIMLYATVPVVYYLMKRFRIFPVLATILVFSILYNEVFYYLKESTGSKIFGILQRQVGGQLLYFYSGTLILLYFEYFRKYIKFLFPVAVFVCYFRYDIPLLIYFEPLAFAIVLIGCAYYVKWFVFMRKFDNVAYGIYLFHFPVIQLSVWLGIDKVSLPLCFIFCVSGTLLLSLLSWFLLEKPVLTNRFFSSKKKKTVVSGTV